MPIFEYQCRGCGRRFDFLVLHSTPPPECPSCGGDDLEKMISTVAVSSAQTQQRSLEGAKRRVDKLRFEREYEAHKTAHDHDH